MSKLLIVLSFLAVILVMIGTAVAANNPMFWLASGNANFQYVRAVLAILLFVQLTTKPPRNLVFRMVAGSLSLIIGVWAIGQTYDYHMGLLDTLAFTGASLTAFATALERKTTLLVGQSLTTATKQLSRSA